MGLEFGIIEGYGWVHSLVLVGKPGFGRGQSLDLESRELWGTLDVLSEPKIS